MAWRGAGSLSRSAMSAVRAPSIRNPPPLPRLRSPTSSAPRLQSPRLSFAPSRNLGELGCIQTASSLFVLERGGWISTAKCNSESRESDTSLSCGSHRLGSL
ncbi:hypothetical protein V6N13_124215 [Hibiscus sabdariffa]